MNKPKVEEKKKKEIIGTVVSTAMKNTVVIAVTRLWHHPIYKKALKRTKKLVAHVEGLEIHVGDKVKIVGTRPISKTKKYKVTGKV